MKSIRYFITFAGVIFSFALIAQSAKVNSAANYLRYGELDKAKEAIDAAATHEKTMNKAKTWVYRTKVYLALAASQDEKYADIRPNALHEALVSVEKAKELADSKTDKEELNRLHLGIADAMFQLAIDKYNSGDYTGSYQDFATCGEIKNHYGTLDTLAFFNAALSATKAGSPDKALNYYNLIKKTNYRNGAIFINMSEIYIAEGKDDEALAILEEGRAMNPDNQSILVREINLYLKNNRNEEALAMLNEAIAKSPENSSFYFARGSLYEQQGDIAKAEADYKKALELDPQNVDANYNLGALYINESAKIAEEMNNLGMSTAEQKRYEELKPKLMEMYKKALPYLEKAYENDPQDKAIQQTLMRVYGKVGNTEGYKKMKAIYEGQ